LEMVAKESLRLFPPSPFMARINTSDTPICQRTIPQHSLIMFSPYVIHRDGRNYENANDFIPERWTEEYFKEKTHSFKYIPFGGGRRICVGQKFAFQEAKLALATLFREFSPKLLPSPVVEPAVMIILRPKNGVKVQL